MPEGGLALTLKAVPENIARARQAVADIARRCGADAERVALATSEAVTSVVRSAGRATDRTAEVHVQAERAGDELVVTVSAEEAGPAPSRAMPGMGAGLALISSLAASFGFRPTGSGLGLTMRFPCSE